MSSPKKLTSYKWKCNQCDAIYVHETHLTNHMNKPHVGVKRHNCRTCKKSFISPNDLYRHRAVWHNTQKVQNLPTFNQSIDPVPNHSVNPVPNNIVNSPANQMIVKPAANQMVKPTPKMYKSYRIVKRGPNQLANSAPIRFFNSAPVRFINPARNQIVSQAPTQFANPAPIRFVNSAPVRLINSERNQIVNQAPTHSINSPHIRFVNAAPVLLTNPTRNQPVNQPPTQSANPAPVQDNDWILKFMAGINHPINPADHAELLEKMKADLAFFQSHPSLTAPIKALYDSLDEDTKNEVFPNWMDLIASLFQYIQPGPW